MYICILIPFMEENKEILQVSSEKTNVLDTEQNRVWEENHKKIMECIQEHLRLNETMPTASQISEMTHLSRVTVHKHIQNIYHTPEYTDHMAIHNFMASGVFEKLAVQAMRGSVSAARLYMQLLGIIKTERTQVNNTLIYGEKKLKIEGIELTEELINNLDPQYRYKIAELLKTHEEVYGQQKD